MTSASKSEPSEGLALRPFRALRPAVDAHRLGTLLCPPYDVVDADARAALLATDPDNTVSIVLPEVSDGHDAYTYARLLLERRIGAGLLKVDPDPALYVYEMRDGPDHVTRGLLGAVELREAEAGVILPHENTMAGPVADRLALMEATQANVEPIYLVYDGGGAASQIVADADAGRPAAQAETTDGIQHLLWSVDNVELHRAVADDLRDRRALIADGHHRYATYLELQRRYRATRGSGPWDRGLTLLVDSSSYGPQVHAIHRILVGVSLEVAVAALKGHAEVRDVSNPDAGLRALHDLSAFGMVLSAGARTVLVEDTSGGLVAATQREGEPTSLARLDVTVLHRTLVEKVWGLVDDVEHVGFAHSVDEAVAAARRSNGTAVLIRPTPVADVAAVAAAGARMPRKSTLFTPKPASGMVMRRFSDDA